MATAEYDLLSDLINDELRTALARMDFAAIPRERDGLLLVHLRNDHLAAKCGLLCPTLPPDALVPHRYEGDWRQLAPELAPEPTRRAPISDDPVVARFSRCVAIYA